MTMIDGLKLISKQLLEKSSRCIPNDNISTPTLYYECAPLDSTEEYPGYCFTRKYHNESAIIGQWGYCDPNCRGQEENVHHNLASQDHGNLWSEGIYSLDGGSSGHCHTYNPANSSVAGHLGQFHAFLGTGTVANKYEAVNLMIFQED